MVKDVRERAARACVRISQRRLVITGPALKSATGDVSLTTTRKLLKSMCENGSLLRAGYGQYILCPLARSELEMSRPTTVFSWWGSKKRQLGLLVAILHRELAKANASTVVAPFVGTGVVEGALKNQGVRVQTFDKDPNIVNMHVALSTAARRKRLCAHFRQEVSALRRCGKEKRKRRFKRRLRDDVLTTRQSKGSTNQAARWLLGMKCSFYGMLRKSSAIVPHRPNALRVNAICEAIAEHRGIGSDCRKGDVFDVVSATSKKALLFLDPPYLMANDKETQYQAGDFTLEQHTALATALKGRSFVLCHREDAHIRNLYKGCEIIQLPAIMRINGVGKRREEMVVIGRAGR